MSDSIELGDVLKWLKTAEHSDILDVMERAEKAHKAKRDEGRVRLLQVAGSGLIVGHFREGRHTEALAYLQRNVAKLGPGDRVEIHPIRVIMSEVEQRLSGRWWP